MLSHGQGVPMDKGIRTSAEPPDNPQDRRWKNRDFPQGSTCMRGPLAIVHGLSPCYTPGMRRLTERILHTLPDHSLDRPLLGYIRGDLFSIAFDAGASRSHVESFYSMLDEMNLPRPLLTVISHHHWDHSYGMHAINGLSVANEKTYELLKNDMSMPKELIFAESIATDYDYLRKEYLSAENIIITLPDITYRETMTINAGGIKAVLCHAESPHTDDSTLMYIPEERLLFTGDAASGEIRSASDLETGGKYSREKTEALICTIRRMNPLYVINSHEGMISAEEEIGYLESVLAR